MGQSILHDVVNGLTMARGHAMRMAEQLPHQATTLETFSKELGRSETKLALRYDAF
jgi:hypothetical protein